VAAGLGQLRTRLAELLVQERALLLAAPAIGVFLAWAAVEGGYSAIYWYPGALLLLGLLVAAAAGRRAVTTRLPRSAVVAGACLAAYTAWSFASIAWADVRADAWDGANRTLLYLTVYALFALLPWTLTGAQAVLGTYAFGVAAIAGWTLWRAATSAEPLAYFAGGTRFSSPTDYHNANCALFAFAFFVLVFLASRAASPIVVRVLAAAGSLVLTVVSILGQSRGWLGSVILAALLFLAIVPGRARSFLALLTVGIGIAPLVRRALDVNAAAELAAPGAALDALGRATVAAAAAVAAATLLWALVDRFYAPSARFARTADRALGAGLAAGLLLAALLALALGSPRERIPDAWHDFTRIEAAQPGPTGPYLVRGVSGNRYDLWRVAVGAFRREPLIGIGADNFAVDYFRDRRALEEPRYPHSLELRALAQTGLVGALLLAGFLAAAVWAAAAGRGDSSTGPRATAVVGAAYWLVHGSIDWFWEIPGVTAAVLAALGISAALRRRPADELRGGPRSWPTRPLTVVAVVAAVGLAASYAFPLLSELYVRNAARGWRVDAPAAFAALDRARVLNPLTDRPDLVKGAIASRLGRPEEMRRAFAAAIERNSHNWYAFLELGIADALTGHRRQSLGHLATAAQLNPLEPVVRAVARDVRAGRRVDPREIDDIFLRRLGGPPPPPVES
jgi:hypothetical protein